MAMIRWVWEGNGNNKVIPANLYTVKVWQSYGEFKGGNFFETQCSLGLQCNATYSSCSYSLYIHTVHYNSYLFGILLHNVQFVYNYRISNTSVFAHCGKQTTSLDLQHFPTAFKQSFLNIRGTCRQILIRQLWQSGKLRCILLSLLISCMQYGGSMSTWAQSQVIPNFVEVQPNSDLLLSWVYGPILWPKFVYKMIYRITCRVKH